MALEDDRQITRVWDDFADSGFNYLNNQDEVRTVEEGRKQRLDHIERRQEILQAFIEEESDLESFKSRMASEAASHKLWGYSGPSGAMFFNLLVSATDNESGFDLSQLLREVLAKPRNKDRAAAKIRRLVSAVEQLRSDVENLQSAPQKGFIPYFVSYFWQLQEPDGYPIYYASMRDALSALDIWEPTGDYAEDYIEFWEVNEEIRAVLENHTDRDIHLWDIERMFLYWLGRDEIGGSSDLSKHQRAILGSWEKAASQVTNAKHFKFDRDYSPSNARERADKFIESPSRESFIELWDTLYGAQRAGSASSIYEKWSEEFGRSDDELAELIKEIRQADSYDPAWETRLGAKKTLWELFGLLHIEDYPIMNGSAERGLQFFGYDTPYTYDELVDVFTSFRDEYMEEVGHATAGTDHEVAINFEIDQLLNVIDKVDEEDPGEENHAAAADLYRTVLEENEKRGPSKPESPEVSESESGENYYWITANPSIWQVKSIDDGREVFYTAYNPEGNKRRMYESFQEAEPGDRVVFYESSPTKAVVAEGIVIEGLHEEEHEEHEGPVEGIRIQYERPISDISWSQLTEVQDLEEANPIRNGAQGSLFSLTEDEFETILALEGGFGPDGGTPLSPIPEKPAKGDEIERQILKAGQLVFHGPPGTGKTYTAQRFAKWWLDQRTQEPTEDQLEVVTFHPSFTYEDFIEGLTAEEHDGAVKYQIQDGVFKRVCDRAREAYVKEEENARPYVLIIDEINRGNLAQIFGETITLLEPDKRLDAENETTTTLPHSKERFTIPPNVYVIGTMNTADRSIALVDAALRRRFRFISFPPKPSVLYKEYGFDGAKGVEEAAETSTQPVRQLLALSIMGLESLNESIRDSANLGKGNQIGHSYLLGVDEGNTIEKRLQSITDAWKYEILPLLEEYYFSQFGRIQQDLFEGSGGRLFDWEHEQIKNFGPEDLATTLIPLINSPAVWVGPDQESAERIFTYQYLLNHDVLQNGDELIFDSERVPQDSTRTFDEADSFWRCEVTGETGMQDNVRWKENDELYSLTGLARTILEEISEPEGDIDGPQYWLHPRYDYERLRSLSKQHQADELDVVGSASTPPMDE